MRVRATQIGFYGQLRFPDSDSAEFDVPDDDPASSWFSPVDAKTAKTAKAGKKTESSQDQVGAAPEPV